MLKNIRNKKAQNTAEYAILIALVIGGVVAMQTYAQRALNARLRTGSQYMANEIGNALFSGSSEYKTAQYEPYYSNSVEKTDKDSTVEYNQDGEIHTLNTTSLTNKVAQTDRTEWNGVGDLGVGSY